MRLPAGMIALLASAALLSHFPFLVTTKPA